MKKDHLRTYGERAHKKCFGNIFPDDSYVTWTVIIESFTKNALHRGLLKHYLWSNVPYTREAWTSPVYHPKQCERPDCPVFSPAHHHCSILCEERHQEQNRMSRVLEVRRLQESAAKKACQKQAYHTTWGTTDIGGFSELNVIVMNQQVADVIKALTKDTVPLREILELLDIPCRSGSNATRHKHKSSCLYKVLSKLLTLFCSQVNKDLTKKKRRPKTGSG
jgi:hypothetical protein